VKELLSNVGSGGGAPAAGAVPAAVAGGPAAEAPKEEEKKEEKEEESDEDMVCFISLFVLFLACTDGCVHRALVYSINNVYFVLTLSSLPVIYLYDCWSKSTWAFIRFLFHAFLDIHLKFKT